MDRSRVIYLIPNATTQNANGEFVPSGKPRAIFADLRSVSRSEFLEAGVDGLRPEFQANVFGPDYEGEMAARVQVRGTWKEYAIYRTYHGPDDSLELYLAERVGVTFGG